MTASAAARLFPSPPAAPCRHACPIDQNVQEYVACIAEGRFSDAVRVIRETNPFPSICGRVCPRPCERECALDGPEGPVPIRELKRFVADLELQAVESGIPFHPETRKERIAVVGGGACGLTAALDLRKKGYPVTVFEALPFAGGMLALSYPEDVMPRDILDKEIDAVKAAGVELACGMRAGKDFSIDDLGNRGYRAVLIATGARFVPPGRTFETARDPGGFLQPVPWLEKRRTGGFHMKGRSVVVWGATFAGLHWAMLAADDGAAAVTLLTHLPREDLPVDEEVLRRAEARGVEILCLHRPESFHSKRGSLSSVALRRLVRTGSDAAGRAILEEARSGTRKLEADLFIPSFPRLFDPAGLEGERGVKAGARGLLETDPETMAAAAGGIFAAGEAVSGGRSVVEAIASGHRAASGIHAFLEGEKISFGGPRNRAGVSIRFNDFSGAEPPAPGTVFRKPGTRGASKTIDTKTQASLEARKCLRCGACIECDTCHHFCRWHLHTPFHDTRSAGIVRVDRTMRKTEMGGIRVEDALNLLGLEARVDEILCDGCGDCESACPYDVAAVIPRAGDFHPGTAVIDPEMCRACGLCAGACPPRAISYAGLPLGDLTRSLGDIAPAPAVLRCRWSGTPPGEGDLMVGCLGQVPSAVYLKALEYGCRHVLAVGCGDSCRHKTGYRQAQKRAGDVKEALGAMGVEPRRIEVVRPEGEEEARRRLESLPETKKTEPSHGADPELDTMPAAEISSAALLSAREGKTFSSPPGEGIAYFPGCFGAAEKIMGGGGRYRAEEALSSASHLLAEAAGLDTIAQAAGCCGLPLLRSGRETEFGEIARSNVAGFLDAHVHTLVISCAACMSCFRSAYRRIEGADRIRFIHAVTFLREAGARFTLKEACAARRIAFLPSGERLGEDKEALELLSSIPGLEVIPLAAGRRPIERGWEVPGRRAKEGWLEIIDSAAGRGAEKIVTTSHPDCFQLLRAVAEGTWKAGRLQVTPLMLLLEEDMA